MNDAFLKLLIIKTGVRDRQCISKMHSCTCTLYIYIKLSHSKFRVSVGVGILIILMQRHNSNMCKTLKHLRSCVSLIL